MFGRPRRPHEDTGRRARTDTTLNSVTVSDTGHPVVWTLDRSRIHHESRENFCNEITLDENLIETEPQASQKPGGPKGHGYVCGPPEQLPDLGRSVMDAPRPLRGNNLFGGKQKTYKITSSGKFGRQVYDDFGSLSPFQRLRRAERRAQNTGRLDQDGLELQSSTPVVVLSESAAHPSTSQSTGTTESTFSQRLS